MQGMLQQMRRLEKEKTEVLLKAEDDVLKQKDEELKNRGREQENLQTELKKLQNLQEFKPTMVLGNWGPMNLADYATLRSHHVQLLKS
ncbi:hypothetical protein JHK86_020245 [Glycine max]|nr:hypothetical protein JHK86_020245 [Glycine max]